MNQINSLLESYINMFKADGKLNLLNLQPGQVVRGQVLELITNNNALVSINNNKLLARLEIPLTKGQSSWFVVTSVGDEIKLKILAEDSSTNKTVTDLQGLMSKLNIKNTNMNKTILSEIIKMEIPLEKGLVENVSNVVKENHDIENVMQAVKFLKNKNIAISSTNIRSINELFQNQDLLNKLNNVNNGIKSVLNEKGIENLNKLSNNQNIQSSDKMISQLLKVSTQIEYILNDYKSTNSNKTMENEDIKTSNQISNFNIEKVDSKQISINIAKFIDLLQQQYTFNSIDKNLFKSFDDLLTYKSNLPNELIANVEKTINHIIGQNIALVQEQSIFSQILLQFPGLAPFSEKPVFVQVHTKKKNGSKDIDSEDMMLVFLFNLDNLGDVMVQMKILNKQLFIQVNNNNPEIKEIINLLEPEFIHFVEKNGYQTSGLSVTSIRKKQDINNSSFQSAYEGVDIKI